MAFFNITFIMRSLIYETDGFTNEVKILQQGIGRANQNPCR